MHKSNFGGHSKDSYGNIGAYATMGMRMQATQFPDYLDGFFNNTIVFGGAKNGHGSQTYIEVADTPLMCPHKHCYQRVGNNTVYAAAEPTVTEESAAKGASPEPLTKWLA